MYPSNLPRVKHIALIAAILAVGGGLIAHAAGTSVSHAKLKSRSPVPVPRPNQGETPVTHHTPGETPEKPDAPVAGKGKLWAIVVGIDKYDGHIPSLDAAVSDAHRVAKTLLDPRVGRFSRDNVTLLDSEGHDPALRPTKKNILKALTATVAKAGPLDTVWFYFAGHGMDRDVNHVDMSYILPVDYQPAKFFETTIGTQEIRNILNPKAGKAKRRVIILDSCHSGSTRGITTPEPIWNAAGTVRIAACRQDQSALERTDPLGGVFTRWLVLGLDGEADLNHDHIVTAYEMKKFLPGKIKEDVSSRGEIQDPVFDVRDDLPLTYASEKAIADNVQVAQGPLKPIHPLGPALVLDLHETIQLDGGALTPDELFATEVTKELIDQNIQIVDEESARKLKKVTDSAAAAAAKAMGARFLLRGTAAVSLTKLEGNQFVLYTPSITLTIRLIDEAGTPLYANTFKLGENESLENIAGVTTDIASSNAVKKVTKDMLEQVMPAIKKALAGNTGSARSVSPKKHRVATSIPVQKGNIHGHSNLH